VAQQRRGLGKGLGALIPDASRTGSPAPGGLGLPGTAQGVTGSNGYQQHAGPASGD